MAVRKKKIHKRTITEVYSKTPEEIEANRNLLKALSYKRKIEVEALREDSLEPLNFPSREEFESSLHIKPAKCNVFRKDPEKARMLKITATKTKELVANKKTNVRKLLKDRIQVQSINAPIHEVSDSVPKFMHQQAKLNEEPIWKTRHRYGKG